MHDKRRIPKKAAIVSAAFAAVFMFALFLFTHNEADVDLWGNAGFVKHLPNSPLFHRANTFSFTEPDHVWINHEWLAEYILHHTHRIFGNPGLLMLKAFLGFTLLGIIYSSMRRNSSSAASRVIYLLLIISTIGYGFSTRPQLFTYLLSAALLSALLRPAPSAAVAFAAAPLGCLWANLHGAFFIGQIILLTAFVCAVITKLAGRSDSWRTTIITGVAVPAFFAGTLLNPYGIRLWNFVFESAAILRPILSEWAPFNPLTQFSDHVDFSVLALITLLAVLLSIRSCSAFGLTILILSLASAFAMRRNIPFFAIAAGLTAMGSLDKSFGSEIDNILSKMNRHAVIAMLIAAASISALFFIKANREAPLAIIIPRDRFPIEAVAFLKQNRVEANAIVFFDWAEQCIWQLNPQCRVFLDGRFKSAYSEDAITAYLDFIYTKGKYMAALNDYPTDLVFVHINNPCTAVMRKLEGWETVYQDSISVIFVKSSAHRTLLRNIAMKSAYLPREPLSNIFP
jgi:hypothetical protein